MVPVPYEELPLRLPPVENFEPGKDGESPLAKIRSFSTASAPSAVRQQDGNRHHAPVGRFFLVLPPLLRSAQRQGICIAKEALKYWIPVDWYNGGMEHTTLHLLYSRFWHKFLYDIGRSAQPRTVPEAYLPRHDPGPNPTPLKTSPMPSASACWPSTADEKGARKALVEKYGEMAEHPIVKMSKSLGNVVYPDDVVNEYGADTLRLYEMFIGDFEKAAPWNTNSIKGCKRFLERSGQ